MKAARTMGLSNSQIIWRHVLPNSLTPVITFLPFRMSAAILSLTGLDFLGARCAAADAEPRRIVAGGQEQSRRMVDFGVGICRAGCHAAAADVYRRRVAQCARRAFARLGIRWSAAMNRTANERPLLEIEGFSRALRRQASGSRSARPVYRARRARRAGRRIGFGQERHRAVHPAARRSCGTGRAHSARRRRPVAARPSRRCAACAGRTWRWCFRNR